MSVSSQQPQAETVRLDCWQPPRDPAAAREILSDIVTRFPASFWAGDARRRLDELPGAGSTSTDGRS